MVLIASTARNFLLLVSVLSLTASCGRESTANSEENLRQALPKKPNVLLVVVDTLRADHLQPYGYSTHPTSPFLNSLASESITVSGLTGVSSWTMPSMATLFSGKTPAEHGVMRMRGPGDSLQEPNTLAASFRQNGYATGCVMSNFLLLRGRGFNEGYDFYNDHLARNPDPHRGSTAEQVADEGLAWLKTQAKDQPWFLTLHFFDPHTSYEDHDKYSFTDQNYAGWVEGGLADGDYKAHQESATPADQRQLAALYDEEIRIVDDAFRKVILELKNSGSLEQTIVIFTSDHGEELAERGYIGHTRTLHFEQIDLPLIVRLPGGIGGGLQRRGIMSQVHLHSTILDLAGLSPLAGCAPSMADWVLGVEESKPNLQAFFEVDFVPIKQDPKRHIQKRGVQIGDQFKFIRDLNTGKEFLFDLKADPQEKQNRVADLALAKQAASMRLLLADHAWFKK